MLKHIISKDILIIVNSVENNLKPEPVIETTLSVHMQLINLNKDYNVLSFMNDRPLLLDKLVLICGHFRAWHCCWKYDDKRKSLWWRRMDLHDVW